MGRRQLRRRRHERRPGRCRAAHPVDAQQRPRRGHLRLRLPPLARLRAVPPGALLPAERLRRGRGGQGSRGRRHRPDGGRRRAPQGARHLLPLLHGTPPVLARRAERHAPGARAADGRRRREGGAGRRPPRLHRPGGEPGGAQAVGRVPDRRAGVGEDGAAPRAGGRRRAHEGERGEGRTRFLPQPHRPVAAWL
uniref:Uncharacterized protein n=1 Tax=Arundo donax TaxID=35708 RepID=A0A0A9GY49_ARUDO